mgnify:CR=1 FL=1
MTSKLTPMERALLDTLDQMTTAAQARDTALSAQIANLTRQLQQHEKSVAALLSLLKPFLAKPSSDT